MKIDFNHFRQTRVIIIFLFAIISGAQISSAANWQMHYKDANHSALNPANGALSENVLWKFEIGESINPSDGRGFNHSFASGSPVIAEGAVYIRSYDGYLYAVDANSGMLKWKFKTPGIASLLPSSLAVFAGTVYVGSDFDTSYDTSQGHAAKEKGYLDALDAATGKLKWEFLTGNVIDSSPAVDNGSLYFGSDGIYALDAHNGNLKWKYDTVGTIQSPLVISYGNLYYSGSCGDAPAPLDKSCVYAMDANGKLKWKHEGGNSELLVSNGIVFTATYNTGYMYALDAFDGNIKWSYKTGYPNPLFVSNGILYLKAIPGDISVNKRFEAKLLIGDKTIPVLDGGDIEAISPLEKDQYGIWGIPVMFTENGANKLRDAVVKYKDKPNMVFYLDGEVIFKVPIPTWQEFQPVPIRNILIGLGKDLDTENKTRAERLKEAFEGKTRIKAIGLDIYSGKLVSTANISALYEFGEYTFLPAEQRVAYVEGITYKYSGDPPIYLYAIGEKAPPETQSYNSKGVAGFEVALAMITLLLLSISKQKRFKR